jgi:hypothetical protein
MDDGNWSMWNNIGPSSSWTWNSHETYTLSTGFHSLSVAFREDGAKLDKLYLTKTSASPVRQGNDAVNCDNSSGYNLLLDGKDILIYPNPANDVLYVNMPNINQMNDILFCEKFIVNS